MFDFQFSWCSGILIRPNKGSRQSAISRHCCQPSCACPVSISAGCASWHWSRVDTTLRPDRWPSFDEIPLFAYSDASPFGLQTDQGHVDFNQVASGKTHAIPSPLFPDPPLSRKKGHVAIFHRPSRCSAHLFQVAFNWMKKRSTKLIATILCEKSDFKRIVLCICLFWSVFLFQSNFGYILHECECLLTLQELAQGRHEVSNPCELQVKVTCPGERENFNPFPSFLETIVHYRTPTCCATEALIVIVKGI